MYTNYYLQANKAAQQIRERKGTPSPKTSSIVERKRAESEEERQRNPLKSMVHLMAEMDGARQDITPKYPAFNSKKKSKTAKPTGEIRSVLDALASIESAGSGDYAALGPVMEKGSYKGDRAYGRYQVMGRNIPVWTEEILGVAMTPEEFLNDRAAQDLVASERLKGYYTQYGSWDDAASAWFTGGPLSKNKDKSDGYITAQQYVDKFNSSLIPRRKGS